MNLSLFGIGASLEAEDGYCKIRELLPGGPAARSGLLNPGDRIVAVAQAGKAPVDIVNMPLSRAVELIRGPKGSSVTLDSLTEWRGRELASRRPSLSCATRSSSRIRRRRPASSTCRARGRDPAPRRHRPAVVLRRHGRTPAARPSQRHRRRRSALTKLKAENVRGIVMDLRHNGGGSLDEAITLTGLFIRKGPVVQTRDPTRRHRGGSGRRSQGPLRRAAGLAHESIQCVRHGDSWRARSRTTGARVVVGDSSTFGKGTVQNILPLAPSHGLRPASHTPTIRAL